MARIESLLILTVAALDLAVVPRRIGADQFMPDAQLGGGQVGVNALGNRVRYGAAKAQWNRDVQQNTAQAMGAIGGAGQLRGTKSAPAVQETQPVQMPVRVENPMDNFDAAHEAVDNDLRSPRLTTYEQRCTKAGAETGTSVVRERVRNMDAMTDAAAERARERQTQQEEAGRQIPETLRRLGVEPYGSEADYAGAETLAREAKNSNSAR